MLMQHNLHLLGMVAASILAVAPTDAFAYAKAGEQTPVTVNVTTAGTLNTLVTSDQKFTTTSLVVKGDLNGADILFLREMAGSDKKGVATEGKLEVLDLTEANFVAGGGDYYDKSLTEKGSPADATVGSYCFAGTILKEVKLPNSVTKIKDSAFEKCAALTSVTFSKDVTEVGTSAFSGCTSLKSFEFPKVKIVSAYVLSGCTALTKVVIPETVTDLKGNIFKNCSALTEIHIAAANVPSINYSAFSGITQSDITLYVPDESLKKYQDDYTCKLFKEVKKESEYDPTVNPGEPGTTEVVRSVELTAAGTLSTTIDAAEKLTITSLTIKGDINGDDLLYIREMAGRDIKSDPTSGKLEILDLTDANFVAGGGKFYEKDTWNKAAAAENTVQSHCFEMTTLKEIKLPKSLRAIKSESFKQSNKLTAITIPEEVTEVGDNAFEGCSSLVTFDFPKVTKIAGSVLANCTALTKITIPATVTELSYGMFSGCSSVTEIHIAATTLPNKGYKPFDGIDQRNITLYVPAGCADMYKADTDWSLFKEIKEEGGTTTPETGVKTIDVKTAGTLSTLVGADKFNLTEIKVTGDINSSDILCLREMAGRDKMNVETSGKLVSLDLSGANIVAGGDSYYKNSTTNLEFTTTANIISEYMFDHCKLESFVFPATATAIEGGAFGSCYNLKGTLTIPDNITRIGNYAFEACVSLEHVVLPAALKYESFSKPDLGSNVFSGCHALKDIVIPEGVTRIRTNAFRDCFELTKVTLPTTVTYIDGDVFKGCKKLAHIFAKREKAPTANYGTFEDGIYPTCTVHVPAGSVDNYRGAFYWENFTNIVEGTVDGIGNIEAGHTSKVADGIYTLNGVKVSESNLAPGIYIVRKNGVSMKFVKR